MRLKSHLDSIVSDAQAAFIPGRLVNDNVMIAHEIMHSLKVRKRVSQTYLAVKTDVSKAYDRVEWNFLETTMRLFGFCDTWINWIMATVRTVQYSILINGTPHGLVKPERGIRQGDPLSPYLFILCADILSHLIRSKASSGDIRGIRIGNGVPTITHLQFADDSLFFCQANQRNCQALKDAFDVYEYYSGQKINLSKSLITFGSRVYGQTQNRLKHTLGISNHGGGGKYLGLPEQFGRKKSEMFTYIIERVKKQTSSWSAKYLSPAGKEIMIKSVALAMPVYSMSCFKLPQGIISEIESLLMNFWWEKSSQQRGIPWIAWKRLQYSKKEGGLGFKDLSKFNDALLAKQAWRLITHPTSLFARLMKARYFKDDSILDAKARKYQSYGWSSLLSGLALIKKGSRFIIGNGNSIRLDIDNVLPSHPPRPISLHDTSSSTTAAALISNHGTSQYWNSSTIQRIVNPLDHQALFNLHLPQHPLADQLIWHYTSSGEYTVRSGYWLLTHDPGIQHRYPSIPPGSVDLKNRNWKLPIVPKIKHFIWRVLSNALATTTQLASRRIPVDPLCPQCGLHPETVNHILFYCPNAHLTWRLSNLVFPFLHDSTLSLEDNMGALFDFSNQSLLPFWLIWKLWKARNNYVFNQIRESPTTIVLRSQAELSEWIRIHDLQPSNSPTQSPRLHRWVPPSSPLLKCNFDAAFDPHTSRAIGG